MAVLIVLQSEDKFLLLKRAKPPNQGMYTPVGGKLEPHEGPLEAAIRETKEETGIEVNQLSYAGVLVETSPVDYNWVSFVYWGEIEYRPAPPCNEGTLQWVSFDQLAQISTPPTDWLIYKFLSEGKGFCFDAHLDAKLNLRSMREGISGKLVYGK